jgi:hypothetical protein
MEKLSGVEQAIEIAARELKTVDLDSRCPKLELPPPENGHLELRLFGADARLDLEDWSLTLRTTGQPARPHDLVLLLHYLCCDLPVEPTGELISFRSFPSGQFYFDVFQNRSAAPLVGRIGNDLDTLKQHLDHFDWQPTGHGDLGAQIHAMGNLHLTLVYHLGDDEFPAAADVLFDSCFKRALGAEDAAVMASRVCLGLL